MALFEFIFRRRFYSLQKAIDYGICKFRKFKYKGKSTNRLWCPKSKIDLDFKVCLRCKHFVQFDDNGNGCFCVFPYENISKKGKKIDGDLK